MADALWRLGALACCFCGMSWLALALRTHWKQVRGPRQVLPRRAQLALRCAGALALLAALFACLQADYASMAWLVWVMALTASMLLVAFTLAWRPRWLGVLVAFVRPPELLRRP